MPSRSTAVKFHAMAWRSCVGIVAALGLVCALLAWPVVEVAVTFVVTAFLAAMWLAVHATGERGSSDGRVHVSDWLAAASQAARAGIVAVALGGLIALSPPLALLLLVVATVSSPYVLARVVPRVVPQAGDRPTTVLPLADDLLLPVGREVDRAIVPTLSMTELCHAWRVSYASLAEATSPTHCAAVVASRQACLDEIERRDPDGLHAWLMSGARASGSPQRFLGGAAH